jgi:hypothetical protein
MIVHKKNGMALRVCYNAYIKWYLTGLYSSFAPNVVLLYKVPFNVLICLFRGL